MLYARIDGSLTVEQRKTVIHQFSTVPEMRILLLSYGSGSVGLNLEVATHVHLLEPHWNPMVEAQAAARVDRLDQTKDVFIYRYIVKDSIEENIQKAQRVKLMDIELSTSRMATGQNSNTDSNFMRNLGLRKGVFTSNYPGFASIEFQTFADSWNWDQQGRDVPTHSDIMRLLNAKTKKLEEFFEKDIPFYAILSHTWGKDEVLFKDITKGRYNNDSEKIEGCCRQALSHGLEYVWIDTCCIDKRSSAELSEAINSMFSWYKNAKVCYAYLADVHNTMDLLVPESTLEFRKSRWWTRGWTLQELLAPKNVNFYNVMWTPVGAKLYDFFNDSSPNRSINGLISEITGITTKYLNAYSNSYDASIAEKMSWAAFRQTTREEDIAYSLLGIFGINMPLLYGEKKGAFLRLQEAIIGSSNDQSIFGWGYRNFELRYDPTRLLAESPSGFDGRSEVVPYTPPWAVKSHYSLTNAGLQIFMRLRRLPGYNKTVIGLLNCTQRSEKDTRNMVITLISDREITGKATMTGPFLRCHGYPISMPLFLFQEPDNDPAIPIYIRSEHKSCIRAGLRFLASAGKGENFIKVLEVYPPAWCAIVDEGIFIDFDKIYRGPSNLDIVEQQTIHLHCQIGTGESAVIRLDYGFRVAERIRLSPSTLKTTVARLKNGISLTEALIEHDGQIDAALDWKQQLDLSHGVLTFTVKKGMRQWTVHLEIFERYNMEDGYSDESI